MTTKVSFEEFKKHPVFVIRDEKDRVLVSFGLKKAHHILCHFEDIKKFIEEKAPVEVA